jgi:hypothetical protein
LATIGVAIGLLGGTATGIYLAAAADSPNTTPNQAVKNQDAQAAAGAPEKSAIASNNVEAVGETGPLTKPLKNLKLDPTGSIVLKDLFQTLEDETGLIIRVDVREFRRLGIISSGADDEPLKIENFLNRIYGTKAILPRRADKLPLRDVLADVLPQILLNEGICTYQIRGTQIVILPSYQVPNKPGLDPLSPLSQIAGQEGDEAQLLPFKILFEQIYGGVVNVSADKKPLTEILAELRKQTGANIVLDPRCQPQTQRTALSISLNDVRLYDALRVIADMAELKMVYAGNIYYVTTTENAKAFQPPPVVRPIVYSTSPWGLGGGGLFQQPVPANNPAPANNSPPASDPKKP